MKKLRRAISYSFFRNIGWQDRLLRTIAGVAATVAAVYFFKTNKVATISLALFAAVQFWTVLSARCIVCYIAGQCTISKNEKKQLADKGINFEK